MNKQVRVKVVEGCECPSERPWFNCGCRDVTLTEYDAPPMNLRAVFEEGEDPSPVPSVESVGEIMARHPEGKVIYFGGDYHIYGGGHDGKHVDLARAIARQKIEA